MEIKRVNDYGVAEDYPNELKIIREIDIQANKDFNEMLLLLLSNTHKLRIKNYNVKDLRDNNYDLYLWHNEDDMSYITLAYNPVNGVKNCIEVMSALEGIVRGLEDEYYIKGNVVIKMNSIDELVKKINNHLDWVKKYGE